MKSLLYSLRNAGLALLLVSAFAWQANGQCLNATYGQWPGATFTPACTGTGQTITAAAWTSEYSVVNVEAGTTYTFSSSVGSHFITIANSAGTAALATGTGSVVWPSNLTGSVRFYTHLSAACDGSTVSHSRIVACSSAPSVAPANDLCANATPITCAASPSGSGTTVGATVDVVPACGTSVTAPGVWYKFTADVLQMFYNVSTCNKTSFDTKLSVYVGSCGELVCIGSNDNAPDCTGGSSNLTFRPVWGAEHYLLVHGAGSQTGTYQLTLTCGVSPFGFAQEDPGQTVGSGKIALFPNPTQDVVNVDVRDYMGHTAIATVFNNVGQMVVQRNLGEIQIATERIELGNLPAGMYYLSLNVEGQGVFTEKFLVNNN
jgi:hypothetical protein